MSGGTFGPRGPADEPLGGPAAAVWPVSHSSQVGEVRRAGEAMAFAAGLGEVERGALAVVVTEIATNLARHATDGRVLLSTIGAPDAAGIQVLAIDAGPGIPNVDAAFADGFSTGGTPGNGLGAIRRMAHDSDLYTQPAGTALVARVWSADARRAPNALDSRTGVVCVPLAGERACGDAWLVLRGRDRTLVVVADGLGHGPEAALASSAAIRVARDMAGDTPLAIVQAAHVALRPTRGAALAVAVLPAEGGGTLRFAGVGNVSAAVHAGGASKSLASHNGTVGHATRTVQEFSYDWPAGAALVMHSDGLTTRWRLDAYPGALRHDPALLAGVLYRDAARGRDDATVVVVRGA